MIHGPSMHLKAILVWYLMRVTDYEQQEIPYHISRRWNAPCLVDQERYIG